MSGLTIEKVVELINDEKFVNYCKLESAEFLQKLIHRIKLDLGDDAGAVALVLMGASLMGVGGQNLPDDIYEFVESEGRGTTETFRMKLRN